MGKVLLASASSYRSYASGLNAQNANSSSSKQYWSNAQKKNQLLSNNLDLDASKKFSKSFDDINAIIMVTKAEKQDKEKFRIVKVDKKDGKIIREVKVNDRKPDYIFDPTDSIIYLFRDDKIMAIKI